MRMAIQRRSETILSHLASRRGSAQGRLSRTQQRTTPATDRADTEPDSHFPSLQNSADNTYVRKRSNTTLLLPWNPEMRRFGALTVWDGSDGRVDAVGHRDGREAVRGGFLLLALLTAAAAGFCFGFIAAGTDCHQDIGTHLLSDNTDSPPIHIQTPQVSADFPFLYLPRGACFTVPVSSKAV